MMNIHDEIQREVDKQEVKWGKERRLAHTIWLTVLSEEVGEAAKEVLEHRDELLRMELVQCAAVIVSWIDNIDRNRAPVSADEAMRQTYYNLMG